MSANLASSPRLLKGALVVFETKIPVPTNLIVFQYNPEKMSRRFEQQKVTCSPRPTAGNTRDVVPPVETFQLSIELDAADQLASANPLAMATGLHPTLAALELLLYPPSSALILNKALALAGLAVVTPAASPLVLFVWGPARVVPVRVTSVSVTEQAFDPLLNPIRAQVELGLCSLTQPELDQAGVPFSTLGLVRQVAKEVLARTNIVNSAEQITSLLPF